ncbi:unnamed protein product [Phytophthora lilii]|uniref:Unnamed protein product n=1 Tax=Phytophthora lilii TaxID=2077276 RepID=A0A9W6TPL5_9STRA|nr:unnamed protein product [Phytophthora lilii]
MHLTAGLAFFVQPAEDLESLDATLTFLDGGLGQSDTGLPVDDEVGALSSTGNEDLDYNQLLDALCGLDSGLPADQFVALSPTNKTKKRRRRKEFNPREEHQAELAGLRDEVEELEIVLKWF